MAYRRFGFKYPIYELNFDTGDGDNYGGIAFDSDNNEYVINIKFLKKVLKIIDNKGQYSIRDPEMEEIMIPVADFFEIAGIEEAAHLMFVNEKRHLGTEQVVEAEEKYKYLTSEVESRALTWKLAYVKRYMPQYYDALKKTTEKVRKIRFDSIKKQREIGEKDN